MGRKPDLTPEQAKEVRELYAGGTWTMAALAHSFRVNYATITAVINQRGAYRRQEPRKPGAAP